MKRQMKRIVALVLALVMLLTLQAAPTLAATSKESQEPAYEYYVPIGTSITGGYGMGSSWWGVGVAGSFGEGVYPALVDDYFDIDDHYDGALLGTRAKEFRVLLEDDFHGDSYTEGWAEVKCGNGEEHLKEISAEYKAALAQADLITIELGSNDIFSNVIYDITSYLSELAEEAEEGSTIQSILDNIEGKGTGQDFATILAAASELGIIDDIAERILEGLQDSISDYKTNFDAVIKDIRDINPNADMVVLGVYNPIEYLLTNDITNNDNGSNTLKQIVLGTGEQVNIPTGVMVSVSEFISSTIINQVNYYMSTTSKYASEYTFMDLSNIDLTGSDDGTHPSYAGHQYIADHVVTAVLSNYPCQHLHKTISGGVLPTRFWPGYTGNVVCADCGELISRGSSVTYQEYVKLQEKGNVEELYEDLDVPSFPESVTTYPDVDYSVLAFSSDVHNLKNNISANRLKNWITSTEKREGVFDFLGLCGDNAAGDGTVAAGDEYWNVANEAFKAINDSNVKYHAVTTGNHEQEHGKYGVDEEVTDNEIALANILRIGEATVGEDANYKVFCFGAADVKNSFRDEDITALDNYLDSVDENTPVFIMSHYPLHNTSSRTISNKDKVIEVLNKHSNAIFIWGHNHTDANSAETHYDRVITGSIDGKPINFTYAAAGCMSDSEYSDGSGSVSGKGLVVTVSKDQVPTVTMMYVNADGQMASIPVSIDITKKSLFQASQLQSGYSFSKKTSLEDGKEYLIVQTSGTDNIALNTTYFAGYKNTQGYMYSGVSGSNVTLKYGKVVGGVTDDMVWKVTSLGDNKYQIKNVVTGTYLNASYTGSPATGIVKCDNEVDVFTLESGKLKSSTANKYLTYDTTRASSISEGTSNFFTVRSSGKAFSFYEVPAGTVKEAVSTEKEVEALSPSTTLQAGHKYVIYSEGNALNTLVHDGYTNTEGFSYVGFEGSESNITARKLGSYVYEDMVFQCEKSGNGYTLYNPYTGKYLSATYSSDEPKGGKLVLGDTQDVWNMTNGKLHSKNSDKYLAFDDLESSEISQGKSGLFTVRSKGNASSVILFEVTDEVELHNLDDAEPVELADLEKAAKPVDGKGFVITYGDRALTSRDNSGYVEDDGDTYIGLSKKVISYNENGQIEKSSLTQNMVWTFEKVSANRFKIKNAYTGEYLNASNKDSVRTLYTDSEGSDVWTVKKGILTSVNTGLSLSYVLKEDISEDFDGNASLFTINKEGKEVGLYYIEDYSDLEEPSTFDSLGQCANWKLAKLASGTYTLVIGNKAVGVVDGKLVAKEFSGEDDLDILGKNYSWRISKGSKADTWNIKNTQTKQYLSVYIDSNSYQLQLSPVLSDRAYDWSYDNGFVVKIEMQSGLSSTIVEVLGQLFNPNYTAYTTPYYLSTLGDNVSMATAAISQMPKLYKHVTYDEHKVGEWQLVKEAKCGETGLEERTCSVCGKVESRIIPALEHDQDSVVGYKEATYLEEGYTGDIYCSKCGELLKEGQVTPKLEQKAQTITVKKANYTYKAKALKNGSKTFTIGAKAKGKLTYKVTKGSSKNIVVSKAGKVTLKKACKAGVYKITITAAQTESGEYKKATKVIKVTVK